MISFYTPLQLLGSLLGWDVKGIFAPLLICISSHKQGQQVLTRKKSSCEAELDILTRLPTEMSSKLVVLFPAGNSEVEKKPKTKVHSDFWFRSTSESLTDILGINGQHQSSGAAPEPLG